MTWNRTPIFVVGVVATSLLGLVALPCFEVAMLYTLLDRSMAGSFFVPEQGGSQWLYANLFWLMGHPEVYVILIPGTAAVLEMVPVFARKPLFGARLAVIGIIALVALSILVWAHHMFVSGWAPTLAGPFMLTTELISIPTGLFFLVLIGTIWRGNIWTRLPMLFIYGFLWNFMIGGVTGISCSDVPADNELHGALFVTAHFHFTLLGGAMIGAMGALVYWFPKMTGRMLNERVGTVAFWTVMIGFNVHVPGDVLPGPGGDAPPRRRLPARVRGGEHGRDRRCLRHRRRDAHLPLCHRELVAIGQAGRAEPVARQDAGVVRAVAAAAGELRGAAGGDR